MKYGKENEIYEQSESVHYQQIIEEYVHTHSLTHTDTHKALLNDNMISNTKVLTL